MQRLLDRTLKLTAWLGLALMLVSTTALAQYTHYQAGALDSNLSGKAKNIDPLLVNGWGLAYAPGGPFWVSDEGTGWSTIYDGMGNPQALQVIVPSANSTSTGSPTGIVANPSGTDFPVQGWASVFLFATLDGTISGWAPQSNLTEAIIAVNNSSSNASYTGLAVTNKPSGNSLFAADINNNKVDIYDANFNFVSSFTDAHLPAGFAPFGIQDINGQLYVTFAPASGALGGLVDIFNEDGTFVKRLIQGSPLNQPWGIALAPNNFGPLSNTLLVSNNINNGGTINGFNPTTGAFVGTIMNAAGKPIFIDQLWGIEFGGGTSANGQTNWLYFTAGPNGNTNGLFGIIVPR
jgi:uncharacterized protein (TIGR03118 family)